MKKIYVLWSLAIATFMANVFFACKSDDTLEDFYRRNGFTMELVKTPDFVVYSDGNVLASTLSTTKAETRGETTDAVEGEDIFKVEYYDNRGVINGIPHNTISKPVPAAYEPYKDNAPLKTDRVEQVSQDEYDFVMNYIKNNPNAGMNECSVKKDYFIQNVGSSNTQYYYQIPNWNHTTYRTESNIGGNVMNYLYFNDMYVFESTSHFIPRELCLYEKMPLTNPSYMEMYGAKDNMKYNAYTFYYIEYEGKMCCYLCFDYKMTKLDDADNDFIYDGDGVYDDWVIKITAADGSDIKVPGDTPDTPDTPDPVITDEVEVNLSVNDKKDEGDYIATKLSIHVRALTDVEVYIPVGKDYYCDVDDMAIVYSHKLDPNYQYSNPGKDEETFQGGSFTYIYTVKGDYEKDGATLTANEEIKVRVQYENGGIRVTTDGITQKALDYLQYTYQDGITFEVWNYFNSAIVNEENPTESIPVTREELKTKFNQSTVEFTSTEHPTYYVNAFAMLYDYQKEDIHVYMKDNKPYTMDVTYDATGKVVSETETDNLLDQKYWVAKDDGTFKEFKGEKNAWDCTVTPPTAYIVETTHTGQNPADYNVIYKK